jgi:hypothetical protein
MTSEKYSVVKSKVPPTERIPINKDSEVLFGDAEKKGNIFGYLGGQGNWAVVFPVIQAIPEEDGVNIMIAPRNRGSENFITLDDLDVAELSTALGAVLQFLDGEGNRVVAYNRSSDEWEWKSPNQSWKQHHFQFYDLPYDLETRSGRLPKKLREPFYKQLGKVVTAYSRGLIEAEGLSGDVSVMDYGKAGLGDNFTSRGSAVIKIENEEPEVLARLIKTIDEGYSDFHEGLFSCFVTNYDEVKKSNWNISYELRSQKEASELLEKKSEELTVNRKNTGRLLRFYQVLKEDAEDIEKSRRVYRSPSYVASMVRGEDGLYFVFNPNIFRRAGPYEAVGLVGERTPDPNARLEKRKIRAQELARTLSAQELND